MVLTFSESKLDHWRLYEVAGAQPLPRDLDTDAFTVRRPGVVRVRWSPYWTVIAGRGCVRRAPGDWTLVTAPARVAQRFSATRGLARARSARCHDPG